MGRKGTRFEIPENYTDLVTAKQAEALSLQLQGLTYWEIANKLGISAEAVSERLLAARRWIKDIKKKGPTKELTPREQEVLELQQQGLTNQQIAKRLRITSITVRSHIYNARGKLDGDHKGS